MLKEQSEKLKKEAAENGLLSIAITETGNPRTIIPIPWEETVSAFNMKTPKVTISADDLRDEGVLGDLLRCRIIGCYIFTPLSDYSFISKFSDLADLNIYYGNNIRSLDFLRELSCLRMFYLEDASIDNLEPLIKAISASGVASKCVGFCHCRVKDTSALQKSKLFLEELVVWPSENDSRERWKTADSQFTRLRYREEK